MAYPTSLEKYGSLSATGFAKETTFGTPIAANTFLPMASNTMEEDPGWFSPALMQGVRDKQIYNLYGEAKFTGTVTGPIFPSNAMEVTVASIGADSAVGWGVYGTITTPVSTTITGTAAAGTFTATLTSPTGFAIGQEIIIGSGSTREARLISNLVGSVVTVPDAFTYAHAALDPAVTGTTTTLSAPITAPTSTADVTSATGIVTGTIIQIDVNTVAGGITSEVRKVTNVVTNTLTLDSPLTFNHASAAQVIIVSTPFTHTVTQANTLSSLTVEKNIGGFQSLQFAGCKVGKWDLKAPVGNTAVEMSLDISGQSVAILGSPTGINIVDEMPYVFAEANLSIYGTLRTEASNISVSVDNGLKETYTYSGQHGPSFITPLTIHTSGALDVVFDSLNDATYGDFSRMANGTLGALDFTLVHPANGGTIDIQMPQIALSKYANDLKIDDVVMSTLTYEASRPLSGANQYTIRAIINNSVYLPY